MRLTIAYSKIKKRNLVLINNDTYQRETVSERPIRQPLKCQCFFYFSYILRAVKLVSNVYYNFYGFVKTLIVKNVKNL